LGNGPELIQESHSMQNFILNARATENQTYCLSDFNFVLPPQLIAQHPAPERSSSRFLDGTGSSPVHRIFRDLPQRLQRGDLLVFNDTKVIKARLLGTKASGGQVQALVERILPGSRHEVWLHIKASKSPQAGGLIRFFKPAQDLPQTDQSSLRQSSQHDDFEFFEAQVLNRCGPDNSLFHLRFPSDALTLLEQYGHVPLPPYITHSDGAQDEQRYQTVFAKHPGAAAAPTAALHFDQALLDALQAQGVERAAVTLHVGAGTFQPVRVEDLAEHSMHTEWFDVPAATVAAIAATRAAGGRVVAVGTTTLRALESAALQGPLKPGSSETSVFIRPGFEFAVVDELITNFHLPKSTLLMLVSAFAGYNTIRSLYAQAIEAQYRFFSYGDAMLLRRAGALKR
jgi:S-adenosylmethionine:tRNA ribosyltransferase-isomerase